jgi:hypothetical protein
MLALARPTFPTRRLGLPGPQETTFTGPPVPEAGTDEWLRAEVVYPVVEAVPPPAAVRRRRPGRQPAEARAETTRAIAELAGSYGAA